MKYILARTSIIPTNQKQASHDWKEVIPGVTFSADSYAAGIITDGCDPINQEENDYPTSHAFTDYDCGKLGIPGQIALEKAAGAVEQKCLLPKRPNAARTGIGRAGALELAYECQWRVDGRNTKLFLALGGQILAAPVHLAL